MKNFLPIKKNIIRNIGMLVIAGLVGSVIYYIAYVSLTSTVERSLLDLATQGSYRIDEVLESHLKLVRLMSNDRIISNPDIPMEEKLIEINTYIENMNLLRVNLIDLNGQAVSSNGDEMDYSDRDHFMKAIQGDEYISDPLISKVDGAIIITFAVPIYFEGDIVGVLNSTYSLEELSAISNAINFRDEGYAFVINHDGYILAHPQQDLVSLSVDYMELAVENPEYRSFAGAVERMFISNVGIDEYEFEGSKKFIGYKKIEHKDWIVGVVISKNVVMGNINLVLGLLILSVLLIMAVITVSNIYRNRISHHLVIEKEKLSEVVDMAKVMVMVITLDGEIHSLNPYAIEKLAFHQVSYFNQKIWPYLEKRSRTDLSRLLTMANNHDFEKNFELTFLTNQGEMIGVFNMHSSGNEIEIIGMDMTDKMIAERELNYKHEELKSVYEELSASEEELQQQYDEILRQKNLLQNNEEYIKELAFTDTLTGLPNRRNCEREAKKFIDQGERIAFYFIDVDKFKLINDSYGHNIGDMLLIRIADIFRAIREPNIEFYRFSGDEFSVLFRNPEGKEQIETLAKKVSDIAKTVHKIDDYFIRVTFSIGIASYPHNAHDFNELYKFADIAMYKVKESGRNSYCIFERQMDYQVIKNIKIQNHIKHALRYEELSLVYQPQVNTKDGRVESVEALLRWHNSKMGDISPLAFIPAAEETRAIIPIGEWVLRNACETLKKLHDKGFYTMKMSVNVSVIQLISDGYVEKVNEIIKRYELNPASLELEITESAMIESYSRIEAILKKLEMIGVQIALDDFGTGYSSLKYLNDLPIHILKIDKSFVDTIGLMNEKEMITKSIIDIAKKLRLTTVAEGVENIQQYRYLSEIEVDRIQGYYFSKPLKEADLFMLIEHGDLGSEDFLGSV